MSTVLVVEDDPDVRELIARKLAQAGFEVHTRQDGQAGLEATSEVAPDIVLLDVMMPRLDGIEVCRRMRAEPSTASVPVIMLTAKAQEADVDRGFGVGADDYIIKPFSPRELINRVQAVLARAR
ncbi:MAG: response regulator transcription factor [Actinomycetota bacterium]